MDQPQASTPKQKKGLKKLWAKVKASLRSGSSKKPTEASGQPTTLAASAQEPQRVPTEQPTPTTEPTKSTETPALPTTIPETDQPTQKAKESESKPLESWGIIEVDDREEQETIVLPHRSLAAGSASAKARFDRARAIFEKYNMTLEPSDWLSQSKSNVQRVEKKPRMRIRWTCHQCKATFGRAKLCPQCSHQRCSECVRYPPKKTGERSKKESSKVEAPSTPITEVPTVGACHECKTEFTIGAPECGNCNHKICERCLKETIMASPSTAPPPATADLIAAAL